MIPDGLPMMIYGFRILPNPLLMDKVMFRACRSKRRRIQKKWRKNLKNYISVPSTNIYRLPGRVLAMHPVMVERLRQAIPR